MPKLWSDMPKLFETEHKLSEICETIDSKNASASIHIGFLYIHVFPAHIVFCVIKLTHNKVSH